MNEMIITIPPPTDYDQTKRIRRCPWCFDEAAPSELGVATPQAMKLAIAAKPLATMEGSGWVRTGQRWRVLGLLIKGSHQPKKSSVNFYIGTSFLFIASTAGKIVINCRKEERNENNIQW